MNFVKKVIRVMVIMCMTIQSSLAMQSSVGTTLEEIFSIKNIINVKIEYKKKIFIACLKISELSKEIKFVNVFLKFSSYISIKKIIEKRKYNPPIH